MLTAFVPRERFPGETRVAATPDTIERLRKMDLTVVVESGAGAASYISDADYQSVGASIAADVKQAWASSDFVFKVRPPMANDSLGGHESDAMKAGAVLVGFQAPHKNDEGIRKLAAAKVTALSMELIPRISRAQAMDALSSQASIAGYKAVLIAASRLPRYFPLLMTAAGTIRPAKVVVMGAGVAGLQAIATARRLGASVEVSDIRPAVEEEVQSLGAKFIPLPMKESGEGKGGYAREMGKDFLEKQRAIVKKHIAACNVAITTALIPGRPAPKLITNDMVEVMKPGGVIIDLAVEQGGNCDLSKPDEEVVHNGVTILGYSNLPGSLPADASTLYARNILAFVKLLVKDGALNLDMEDEVVRDSMLTHDGGICHGPTAERLTKEAP